MKLIILSLLVLMNLSTAAQLSGQQTDSTLFDEAKELYVVAKYERAMTIINRLINTNSLNASYYDLRGRIYEGQNQPDSALLNFNRAILLAPGDLRSYVHRGFLFFDMQKPAESIEDFNKAIKYVEDDSLKYTLIAARGLSRMMERDFQGAYEDCKMALEFDSTNVQTLGGIGEALGNLGKVKEAIMYLGKANRLSPNNVAIIGDLGYCYMSDGDYNRAIQQFSRILELSPDEPLAYNNMGYAKYKINNLKSALKDIQRSIELYPENSYAYRNRALVYLAMKQIDKACEDLKMAVNLGYTPRYGNDVQELIEKHCLLKD